MLNIFLKHLPRPVCLVAHNGNQFDFPVLNHTVQALNGSLPTDLLCADSLKLFQDLHHLYGEESSSVSNNSTPVESTRTETTPQSGVRRRLFQSPNKVDTHCNTPKKTRLSFSLQNIYRRVFKQALVAAHSAEGDCVALVQLLHKYGPDCIAWLNANATAFPID